MATNLRVVKLGATKPNFPFSSDQSETHETKVITGKLKKKYYDK